MSNVNLLVHTVISTHHREMTLGAEQAFRLYRYIGGFANNKNCKPLAINGIPNHIHILIDLHPSIALSSFVRDLKHASSVWIKESGLFPMFKKWSEGYFAASVSFSHKESVIDYINNQQDHHRKLHFEDEFERLVLKNGLTLYKYPE